MLLSNITSAAATSSAAKLLNYISVLLIVISHHKHLQIATFSAMMMYGAMLFFGFKHGLLLIQSSLLHLLGLGLGGMVPPIRRC